MGDKSSAVPPGTYADMHSEDDESILSITEQRSGQPSVIRIFKINREDPSNR